jgi:hypothetical protein
MIHLSYKKDNRYYPDIFSDCIYHSFIKNFK